MEAKTQSGKRREPGFYRELPGNGHGTGRKIAKTHKLSLYKITFYKGWKSTVGTLEILQNLHGVIHCRMEILQKHIPEIKE